MALREQSLSARQQRQRRARSESQGRPQSAATWSHALGVSKAQMSQAKVLREYGDRRHPVLQKVTALQRLHASLLTSQREARAKGEAGTGASIEAYGVDSSRLVIEMAAHDLAKSQDMAKSPNGSLSPRSPRLGFDSAGQLWNRREGTGSPTRRTP